MIKFAAEDFTVIADAYDMVKEHHAEASWLQDAEVNPDWETLIKADLAGLIACYTARKNKKIVGYALFVVHRHMHYVDRIVAAQTALYVHPDHRGSMVMRFLAFCDKQLTEIGVDIIRHSVTERKDFSGLLEHLGYAKIENVYAKVVK